MQLAASHQSASDVGSLQRSAFGWRVGCKIAGNRNEDVRSLVSVAPHRELPDCQSAYKFDPRSASNFDPFGRRVLAVALAPSELVGVAETARVRVDV